MSDAPISGGTEFGARWFRGGGRQVRSGADAGQALPAGRVRVGSGRLAGPSRWPRLPGGSRSHRGSGSESCQHPPQRQGAGALVPVPDLPGDGDRTSAPDLPGDGGRSPVPVPCLSGIGDGVPPSPSPICYLLSTYRGRGRSRTAVPRAGSHRAVRALPRNFRPTDGPRRGPGPAQAARGGGARPGRLAPRALAQQAREMKLASTHWHSAGCTWHAPSGQPAGHHDRARDNPAPVNSPNARH
jgi:hypothetical protein